MQQKPPRILIVDSDVTLLQTAEVAFKSYCDVFCAFAKDEGLKKAKQDSPDIIVLGYLEPRGASRQLALLLAKENYGLYYNYKTKQVERWEFAVPVPNISYKIEF